MAGPMLIAVPVCNCISICPRELDSVVKDPHLEVSLYSATCDKTTACPSTMAAIVEAASIRIYGWWKEWQSNMKTWGQNKKNF